MNDSTSHGVIEQVYAAFRQRDLPAILALQADDARWSVAADPELIPWAAPPPGRAGVMEFLRILSQWLVAEVFEIRTYVTEGHIVVALGFQRGTVRPTGVAYEFDFVHVWTLQDARVTSFRVYYDTAYVAAVLRTPA